MMRRSTWVELSTTDEDEDGHEYVFGHTMDEQTDKSSTIENPENFFFLQSHLLLITTNHQSMTINSSLINHASSQPSIMHSSQP
jgi:hypothetical protein